jgi:carbamoyl-phosphate synthase large subunit
VNSNPATIMTDPEFADRTYIEPVTPEYVERIIERERPDAILPTMGGQTALNVAMALAERGVLEKYDTELIGADARSIKMAEDRQGVREGDAAHRAADAGRQVRDDLGQAARIAEWTAFPAIIRPSFTLGGSGGGIAYNREEYEAIVRAGSTSRRPSRCSSSARCSAGRSSSSR